MRVKRLALCVVCGRPYETDIRTRKYCTPLCRSRRDNVRKRIPTDADRARWASKGKRPQGSTTARGYGAEHQRMRARWKPMVEQGQVQCARCYQLIGQWQQWDLGHTPDRTAYTGPEHKRCNRSEGATRGNRQRRRSAYHPRSTTPITSREW